MDDYDRAVAYLQSQMMAKGAGSIGVKDGHIFMFSREYIEGMLTTVDQSGKDSLILFVKSGPELTKEYEQ